MKPLVQPSWARSWRRREPIGRGKHAPPAPPSVPYSAFIAYSSVPAARRALDHVNRLLRAQPETLSLQPMLWRCDQLDHPRWCEMALRDAARANVLVLALAETAPLEAATEAWLTQLALRMRGTELIAFAFTEDDEGWTISLRARAQRAPTAVAPLRTAAANSPASHRAAAEEAVAARAA